MPPDTDVRHDQVIGALWGKSDAGGQVNLLLQHLLDAAAVAELIWDRYLAPTVKDKIDECCGGRGRALFALVCGLHDVGKASPAFQDKVPALAERVHAAGLSWRPLDQRSRRWGHWLAGAVVVRRVLRGSGWSREAVQWLWPLVAGHHGVVPGKDRLQDVPGRGNAQGVGAWEAVQDELVCRVAGALDVDLAEVAPFATPRRAVQLAISGAVIMADWIASDGENFHGIAVLTEVSMAGARDRARKAWDVLGLRGGWSVPTLTDDPDLVHVRFRKKTRASQRDVVELARRMPAPGLLVVEAPMGEGKTEAALAAVEVLSRRFGADGLFMGMPTQATSDPMFTRVQGWLKSLAPDVPLVLLHGKRRFNKEWRALERQITYQGVDDFGCDDDYGTSGPGALPRPANIPAEWFLGRKRGLLNAVTVGTVDQLLHAATRTRHVMLRHAGLAGRVVVLDEVHAYDVYMAQFLFEALRWLGDAQVPVVLLSATLPPQQRAALVRAYLQGALQQRDLDLSKLPVVEGYPSALSACVVDEMPCFDSVVSPSWRSSIAVVVQVLDEEPDAGPDEVVRFVVDALAGGGCALVVRNTVGRAQQTYAALREVFGHDAVLLHARLVVGERTDRAERVLDLLGAPGRMDSASRPTRLVVVATQLAEQSFDVDVDLLVTDLAPIDLLLQRVGRLHRHERPGDARPTAVAQPRVVVTGMARRASGPPVLPPGSTYIYGDHLLLRAAQLVDEAAGGRGWSVPADVPALVARGYGEDQLVPQSWSVAAEAARQHWHEEERRRAGTATWFLLAGEDRMPSSSTAPTLQGLHDRSTAELPDEDAVAAVVRDGPESIEVVLVRHGTRGFLTLDGRDLGPNGEAVSDEAVLDRVLAATVRLPPRPELTAAAKDKLRPLSGWSAGDPWLARTRAMVLDAQMSTVLGGRRLTYDSDLGLVDDGPVKRA